jgi:hypothetical protein
MNRGNGGSNFEIVFIVLAALANLATIIVAIKENIHWLIPVIITLIILFIIAKLIVKLIKKHKQKNVNENGVLPSHFDHIADANRPKTKNLRLRKVTHTYKITNSNNKNEQDNYLDNIWEYSGICIDENGASAIMFTLYTGGKVKFDDMNCYGYDLSQDSEEKYPIKAEVLVDEHLYKRIKLEFEESISKQDTFNIKLLFRCPSPYIKNDDITSTLSFKDKSIEEYKVILEFTELKPKSVKVSKINKDREEKYLKRLHPKVVGQSEIYEYKVKNPSADSSLVFRYNYEYE